MLLRYSHVVAHISTLFFFMAEIFPLVHPLTVDGHLGLQFLAVVNSTALNIHVQVFVLLTFFTFYIPRRRILGPYSNTYLTF